MPDGAWFLPPLRIVLPVQAEPGEWEAIHTPTGVTVQAEGGSADGG
jgi:hypothetical protein